MNNPLRYQITEYDCGPTSVLNGISALFPGRSFRRTSPATSCFTVWTAGARTA